MELCGKTASYKGHQVRVGVMRDISERRRAEQALRESEERFRSLSEATLEGIVIHDGDRVLDANPQVAATHGYELSEFIGMDLFGLVAPDCHDLVRQQVFSGHGGSYEVRGLRKDGTTFPMEVCGKTASYEGRQVRVGVMRDISERRRAEQALRESEERFRRLAEGSIDGIVLIEGSEVRFANAALVQMLGYESDEEVLGRPFTDFVSQDYRELLEERRRARNEGRDVPDRYELRPLREDGSGFDAEISISTITYQGGWARLGVIRDISERKRAEEALQKAREDLEAKAEQRMVAAGRYNLTFRELTVVYLMAAGRADKEIAFTLGISPRTASKHVENVLRKMGVGSRTGASMRALRAGLVGDAD
jgi:PAS domain S-box-containing protein